MITFGIENEAIIWNYHPPTTDTTAPKYSMSFSNHPFDNGPPGSEDYWNHVGHLGWNWVGGTRENESQAGFALSWESKFYDGTRFGQEFHLQGVDINGDPYRWLTLFLPIDGASGSGFATSVSRVNFQSSAGDGRVQMNLDLPTPTIAFSESTRLQFDTNNVPNLQANAAGTGTIMLPFVDDNDRVQCGTNGKGFFVSAASADAVFGAVLLVSVTALAADNAIFYGQQNSATAGDAYGLSLYNMNATGKAIAGVGNNNAAGSAVVEARAPSGGGDAMLSVQINGVAGYTIGIDNSDGDKFKISANIQSLGTNDRFILDASRAEWTLPLKLPSYTVAGLPSAANAGAGALCYVTNASGGATLACSDGTDWKVAAVLGAVIS